MRVGRPDVAGGDAQIPCLQEARDSLEDEGDRGGDRQRRSSCGSLWFHPPHLQQAQTILQKRHDYYRPYQGPYLKTLSVRKRLPPRQRPVRYCHSVHPSSIWIANGTGTPSIWPQHPCRATTSPTRAQFVSCPAPRGGRSSLSQDRLLSARACRSRPGLFPLGPCAIEQR